MNGECDEAEIDEAGNEGDGAVVARTRGFDTRDTGIVSGEGAACVYDGADRGVPARDEESGASRAESREFSYVRGDGVSGRCAAEIDRRFAGAVRREFAAGDGAFDRVGEVDAG